MRTAGGSTARSVLIAGLIALLGLLAMGADSCSTETKSTADKPDNQSTGSHSQKARVGDPITLEGSDTKMKVTMLQIIDPAQGGEFDEPSQPNSRFVGVEIQLQNVGTSTYNDAPSNGAKLITDTNEQADEGLLEGGDCGGDFSSDATVSPGTIVKGCIPFEVKSGQTPKTFLFGLDSGFGPQTGEWRVR